MRNRMAEAYESAARLAANLAARAGVYHIRFGSFGYFAIPVVEEARPILYRYSRDDLIMSFTYYIYFYAQQIWVSLQQVITLLQIMVGYLSLIAQRLRIQVKSEEEVKREGEEVTRHFAGLLEECAQKTKLLCRQAEDCAQKLQFLTLGVEEIVQKTQLIKKLTQQEQEIKTPRILERRAEEEIFAWRSFLATYSLFLEAISNHLYNVTQLLKEAVGHLSTIAQSVAKSGGGAVNINVPFGYDQIRNAIADAVNEVLGRQLALELVRNA
jgi:hypothetical protein